MWHICELSIGAKRTVPERTVLDYIQFIILVDYFLLNTEIPPIAETAARA